MELIIILFACLPILCFSTTGSVHCHKIQQGRVEYLSANHLSQAVVAEEWSTVYFSCNLCTHPGLKWSIPVQWRQRIIKGTVTTVLHPFGKHFVIQPDQSLEIHQLQRDDEGFYFCIYQNHTLATFNLQVIQRKTRKVVMESTLSSYYDDTPIRIPQHNLVLQTVWSSWSTCNLCNTTGQRRRLGTCYIKKLHPFAATQPKDLPAFYTYPLGIPCGSPFLPVELHSLATDVRRENYIHMLGFCKVPCHEESRQADEGETGTNLYNIKQIEVSLTTQLTTRYEQRGKSIRLQCSGKRSHTDRVIWRNGTKILDREQLKQQTQRRIIIDEWDTMHIRRLHLYDSGIYSCFINEKLVGSVQLLVLTEIQYDIHPYTLPFCLMLTMSVIVAALCYCYRWQRQHKRE